MWTQEWSDIPSRSAWTWAMYHQARTWSSALTASRKDSRRRLPRVGARTCASATASRGGLRLGPSGAGAGTLSSALSSGGLSSGDTPRIVGQPPGVAPLFGISEQRRHGQAGERSQPQTGQGLEPERS